MDTVLTRNATIVRLSNGRLVWRRELARRDDFEGAADAEQPANGEVGFGQDFADDFADDEGEDPDDEGGGFGDDFADELAYEMGRSLTRAQRHAVKKAAHRAMRNKGHHGGGRGRSPVGKTWARTIVTGTATLAAAGTASVNIRMQTDFRGFDITFNGSLAGSTITSVFFADVLIWSSPDGVDVSTFAVTGFLRGLVKGQHIGKGTDIIINCVLPGAGSVKATVVGFKPIGVQNCVQ